MYNSIAEESVNSKRRKHGLSQSYTQRVSRESACKKVPEEVLGKYFHKCLEHALPR